MPHAARPLAVLLALAAPWPAAASFRCEQAVQLQATWCTGSQITSIAQRDATAVCTEYSRRLAEQCRPEWDRFKSCQEFAGRFTRLLVKTCEARKIGKKHCQEWGQAYQVGPLARCQRGKTSY